MEKRQKFTAEFRREVVWLLNIGGKPATAVARKLRNEVSLTHVALGAQKNVQENHANGSNL